MRLIARLTLSAMDAAHGAATECAYILGRWWYAVRWRLVRYLSG